MRGVANIDTCTAGMRVGALDTGNTGMAGEPKRGANK